jgi:hypothetical protein
MKNLLLRTLLLSLMLILAAFPTGMALAKEISSITVSGPGINGEISINDPEVLRDLLEAGFIDQVGYMAKPGVELGTPYTISVVLDLDGKSVPFLQMEYYPLEKGQAGYVHYIWRNNGGSMQKQDEWGLMALPADALFRELMTAKGIALQSALKTAPAAAGPAAVEPAAQAAPASLAQLAQPVPIALAAVIALLAAAGLLLRRRVLQRPTSR